TNTATSLMDNAARNTAANSRRLSRPTIIGSQVSADPILARQLEAMAFFLVGMALVGLALYLRLRVFIGREPGGVDTWYYLASAQALRSQKRIPISLPQYLFHDRTESYPVVFPLFLALLPEGWLR